MIFARTDENHFCGALVLVSTASSISEGVVVYDIECWYAGTGTARTERSDPGSIRIEAAVRRSDHWAGGPGMREHTLARRPHAHVHTYSVPYTCHVPRGLSVAGTVSVHDLTRRVRGYRVGVARERGRVGFRPRVCCCGSVSRDREAIRATKSSSGLLIRAHEVSIYR